MNAAARLIQQNILSRGWFFSVLLDKKKLIQTVLLFSVLLSALAVVYVTNISRSLNANLQQTLAERERLHIQWGQLLLEHGTNTMQARVQRVAEDKLDMMVPDRRSVVIVN